MKDRLAPERVLSIRVAIISRVQATIAATVLKFASVERLKVALSIHLRLSDGSELLKYLLARVPLIIIGL